MYWLALMPIQLAADIAPKGARHSTSEPERRPPPRPPRRGGAYVDSHTVRKHRTCRHSPLATASIAAITEPPGPGSSPPPFVHVGRMRSASSTAVVPPSLMPIADMPGYVDSPSMSSRVRPASAT